MSEQTQPKFKVGQVVAFKNMKKQPTFRILEVIWSEEHMIRELTKEEVGA